MQNNDLLDDIPYDAESDTLSTSVWSFTRERAIEKAVNRIDFKAKHLGRTYYVSREQVGESVNPNDPSEGWKCFMEAQLL